MTVVRDYTALLSDYSWWGPGVAQKPAFVSFSFDVAISDERQSSSDTEAFKASFRLFTADEQRAARSALAQWADASGLMFLEVPAGQGDLRFGAFDFSKDPAQSGYAGFASYPSIYRASDGSIQQSPWGGQIAIDYKYATNAGVLLHEIGHAIGMKHPFNDDPTLAADLDNKSQTVMSYTGSSPTALGPLDLQAVVALYGASGTDGRQVSAWGWDPATYTLAQIGTVASDDLRGFNTPDVIQAGAGNDHVLTRGGADIVYGQDGDDIVYGGDGGDTISGGAGNDFLYGGDGSDSLSGGDGNDTLFGDDIDENGNDYLVGGDGADNLYGYSGNDVLVGGTGNDRLDGGTGAGEVDIADFSAASQSISVNLQYGTAVGADIGSDALSSIEVVIGGGAADTLIGGSADDTFLPGAGNDSVNGGNGNDFISYQGLATAVYVDLNGQIVNAGTQGVDALISIEHAIGGNGDDTINCQSTGALASVSNLISCGAGNDVVYAYGGNDVVSGEDGNDYLRGDADNDSLYGGDGADYLYGGVGVDYLNGGTGGDTIYGETGNDTIQGGDDADYVDGGVGDDTIYGENGNDILAGWDGNDYISGGSGHDTAYGQNGNDTIDGFDGFDALYGDIGADLLRGGAGNDYLNGGSDNDSLFGEADDDTMQGGDGADYLQGGLGADTMLGEVGNDTLDGGGGADQLFGGAGADAFGFNVGWGVDTITDFEHGDKIYFTSALLANFAAVQARMQQVGDSTLITVDANNAVYVLHMSPGSLSAADFGFF